MILIDTKVYIILEALDSMLMPLNESDVEILSVVSRFGNPDIKKSEIVEKVDVSKPTVYRSIKKLIDAGYLKEVVKGKVRLTDAGKAILKEVGVGVEENRTERIFPMRRSWRR